jgi:hypothetical protein
MTNLKLSNQNEKKESIRTVKRAMKIIASWIVDGIKATIKFTCKGFVMVFKISKSLVEAIGLSIEKMIASKHPSKVRKILTSCIGISVIAGAIFGFNVSNKFSVKSLASENDNVAVLSEETSNENGAMIVSTLQEGDYMVGMISSKYEIGTTDMLHILDNQYGQFSLDETREDYVIEFFLYMVNNYPDTYAKYFQGKGEPGSKTFLEAWESFKADDALLFAKMQQKYKWDNLIMPVVDFVKKDTKVNLNETLALQELVYSTVSQYESESALNIFKNANLDKKMSEEQIINAVQDAKIKSLGEYTYTDKDSSYHEIIKTRINNERADLLNMLGKEASEI